jgi:phage gpG-like protein
MSLVLDIKGLDDLKKVLGDDVVNMAAKEAIATSIFAGTERIKADAREFISTSDNALTSEQREAAAQLEAMRTGENQLQVRTGRLQNSIQSAIERTSEGNVEGAVFTNVEYARIHELGGFTGKGGKVLIPARPYLTPALTKNINYVLDFMKKEFIGRLKIIASKHASEGGGK